jgi:hypothetical protein
MFYNPGRHASKVGGKSADENTIIVPLANVKNVVHEILAMEGGHHHEGLRFSRSKVFRLHYVLSNVGYIIRETI